MFGEKRKEYVCRDKQKGEKTRFTGWGLNVRRELF